MPAERTSFWPGPVLIRDDSFRFEVDLQTSATRGVVNLFDPLDGGGIQCQLQVVGIGFTEEGDGKVEYSGLCRLRAEGFEP